MKLLVNGDIRTIKDDVRRGRIGVAFDLAGVSGGNDEELADLFTHHELAAWHAWRS